VLLRLKTRRDVQPRTLAEVKNFRVGVIKDDVSERELLGLGMELGRQLDRVSDYPALLRRFFAGHDELLALNQQLANDILRRYGYDPALIEPVLKFSDSRPSMALSLKTSEPLRHRIQKAWDNMRRDGSAASIAARYPSITFE
jgi:polar amino acid transport system substrate-binding protein